MPIYKDEQRGTWFVRVNITDSVTHKPRQVMKRGFKTKREAREWESDYILNAPKSTEHTFSEMHKLYLSDIDATDTNRNMQLNWCDAHFAFNDSPIDKISKNDLVKWRNNLKDKGLATRTMNRGIRYVKAVFQFASDVYDLPNNATVLKSFRLDADDKAEMEVWTIEEFNKFRQCVKMKEYRLFFDFLFWTGCRRGEALALQTTDFHGNKVSITKAIKHYKNGFLPLKTDSSKREILVDDELLESLRPNIESDKPFVFGGETSLSISQVQRQFTQAIKKAGVKPIRLHDLRHSHATFLINNGVNIVAVSKRLGHATINQTLSTYTHLLKETEEDLVNLINDTKKA